MRSKPIVLLALAAAGAASSQVAFADSGQRASAAAAREFEGRVVAVDRADRAFGLRTEHGRRVRITVTAGTRFERLSGFAALRRGLRIEVKARRADGRWIAREVERRRAEARDDRRGDDDPAGDDHGGRHGGDNRGGDDHSGRHGSDDGPHHG